MQLLNSGCPRKVYFMGKGRTLFCFVREDKSEFVRLVPDEPKSSWTVSLPDTWLWCGNLFRKKPKSWKIKVIPESPGVIHFPINIPARIDKENIIFSLLKMTDKMKHYVVDNWNHAQAKQMPLRHREQVDADWCRSIGNKLINSVSMFISLAFVRAKVLLLWIAGSWK